eukprot:scaffold22211_cov38-Cyclotella_meneghiniana.AAC.1
MGAAHPHPIIHCHTTSSHPAKEVAALNGQEGSFERKAHLPQVTPFPRDSVRKESDKQDKVLASKCQFSLSGKANAAQAARQTWCRWPTTFREDEP